jgi:hypothetical protein
VCDRGQDAASVTVLRSRRTCAQAAAWTGLLGAVAPLRAGAHQSKQDRWLRRTYPNLNLKAKKIPRRRPGADFHRRSQLPTELHSARHPEPGRSSAGDPGFRSAQAREDSGRIRSCHGAQETAQDRHRENGAPAPGSGAFPVGIMQFQRSPATCSAVPLRTEHRDRGPFGQRQTCGGR